MDFEIISTGSKGNAVLMGGNILVDCGVSYKALKRYVRQIKLVLLTHAHGDHLNKTTLRKLMEERPTIRVACCDWMINELITGRVDSARIDVLECDVWYDFGICRLSPFLLHHNVLNCGYRLMVENERAFYATDTGDLQHVSAKGYNLYLVEANHTQEGIKQRIKAKQDRGEFAYEVEAIKNHMSKEQTDEWLVENMGIHSEFVYLHQSEGY